MRCEVEIKIGRGMRMVGEMESRKWGGRGRKRRRVVKGEKGEDE